MLDTLRYLHNIIATGTKAHPCERAHSSSASRDERCAPDTNVRHASRIVCAACMCVCDMGRLRVVHVSCARQSHLQSVLRHTDIAHILCICDALTHTHTQKAHRARVCNRARHRITTTAGTRARASRAHTNTHTHVAGVACAVKSRFACFFLGAVSKYPLPSWRTPRAFPNHPGMCRTRRCMRRQTDDVCAHVCSPGMSSFL